MCWLRLAQNLRVYLLDKMVGFSLLLTYWTTDCPRTHHFFTQQLFNSCKLTSILENVTPEDVIKVNKEEKVIDMFPELSNSKGIYL